MVHLWSLGQNGCEILGHKVADHFVDVNKMVSLGLGRWIEAYANDKYF